MGATVISQGLDYSARRLPGASIKRDGYAFTHRYLDFPGQRYPALNAAEVADLQRHGIGLEAIFERQTSDPAGGYDGGRRLATEAVTAARACNLPQGSTIYMCADAWLSTHGIRVSTAMSFLDGARPVLEAAGFVIGAYGFADFVFASAEGGHADRHWLCGARIPDAQVPEWLDVYQWNNGRVYVDGLECDLNLRYRPIRSGATGTEDDMFTDEDRERLMGVQRALGSFEEAWDRAHPDQAGKRMGTGVFEMLEVIGAAYDPESGKGIGDFVRELVARPVAVADVDEDALAEAFERRGITIGGGASLGEIKGAFADAIQSTRLVVDRGTEGEG